MTSTMPDPAEPQPKTSPTRTPYSTATEVDTAAGPILVQAGVEQFATADGGLTAARPVVSMTVGGALTQYPAADAQNLGMTLMIAASQADSQAGVTA